MTKRDFPTFLLYLSGVLLLWEWLRPIKQLTDTGGINSFIVFILMSFIISFFNIKWIWQFIIKGIYILTVINRFYYQKSFFSVRWLISFIRDIENDIVLVINQDWNDLSNGFRTLLFFILLWIMIYLLHYWLLRRRRIFIFFFTTLVYLTVLDTFTAYSAKAAIIRTVIIGFAVMGILTLNRITTKEHIEQEPSFFRKWMVPLTVMITLSVIAGAIVPKAAPIWPDPVPYLKGEGSSKAGGTGGKGPARIGYGNNDTNLGGPFIGDKSQVFKYEAGAKTYWKVETKDIYTGKGWVPSGSTPIEYREGDLVPIAAAPQAVPTIKETAIVYPNQGLSNLIIYPQGIQRIHDVNPKIPEDTFFRVDTNIEKLNIGFPLTNYTVDYQVPKYNAKELTKADRIDGMTEEDFNRYTRVPDELPERIKALTEEITAKETNWYDKAKAVERYFGSTGYTYDQKNIPFPAEGQDYVDQFLFETKRGYCDNFSSSMAVMLRTIGIPTRWIKGFSGGEFLQYSKDNSKQIYGITNNNAHSWVEVFIPGQGWVPFEPTKGFTNELNITYTADGQTPNNQQNTPAPVKKPQKQQPDLTENIKDTTTSKASKKIWPAAKTYVKQHWKMYVLYLILIAAAVGIMYRIRGKWVPYAVLSLYQFKRKDESIVQAYLILLNQLDRYGLKRKENQTLRTYARYIDSFFSTREMTKLTEYYEQYIYHQELPKGTWKESQKLWENLIKKTIA